MWHLLFIVSLSPSSFSCHWFGVARDNCSCYLLLIAVCTLDVPSLDMYCSVSLTSVAPRYLSACIASSTKEVARAECFILFVGVSLFCVAGAD